MYLFIYIIDQTSTHLAKNAEIFYEIDKEMLYKLKDSIFFYIEVFYFFIIIRMN